MRRFVVVIAAGALFASGVAVAETVGTTVEDELIHACLDRQGIVRIVDGPDLCRSKETAIQWHARGPEGPEGPAGAVGADGATGPAGADGVDGAVGAQGPAGTDGADGADGAPGPTGPEGPAGADGTDGAQGPAGADGADGTQGPAGADGADGAQGPAGPAGPTGPQGPQGPPGPSAEPSGPHPGWTSFDLQLYLHMPDVIGGSTDDRHRRWVVLDGYEHRGDRPVTVGIGGSAGKVTHAAFGITKRPDAATIPLLEALHAGGTVAQEFTVEACTLLGGSQYCFATIVLDRPSVLSHEMDRARDGSMIEEVTFGYERISWLYQPTSGSAGLTIFDRTTDTTTPGSTGGPLGLAPMGGNPQLYLTGTGVTGDVLEQGHRDAVHLGGVQHLVRTEGAGTTAQHGPLVLEKTTDRATATLLNHMHQGLPIAELAIETCTTNGIDAPRCGNPIVLRDVQVASFAYDHQQGETWQVHYSSISWTQDGVQFAHQFTE